MEQIRAKTTEWISSKMSTKFEFQSLRSEDSNADSVGQSITRRRVSGHLSAIRHRRPRLSAWTSSTSRHTPPRRLRRVVHLPRAPHFPPPSPRLAPPHFGELFWPHHRVPSRAASPRAPPRRPLPRSPSPFPSRATVRSHCHLRRELHLAGLHRDHRQRGQTSLVHLWPWFFVLQLHLVFLLLVGNLYIVAIASVRRRNATQRHRSAIPDSEHPRVQ